MKRGFLKLLIGLVLLAPITWVVFEVFLPAILGVFQ